MRGTIFSGLSARSGTRSICSEGISVLREDPSRIPAFSDSGLFGFRAFRGPGPLGDPGPVRGGYPRWADSGGIPIRSRTLHSGRIVSFRTGFRGCLSAFAESRPVPGRNFWAGVVVRLVSLRDSHGRESCPADEVHPDKGFLQGVAEGLFILESCIGRLLSGIGVEAGIGCVVRSVCDGPDIHAAGRDPACVRGVCTSESFVPGCFYAERGARMLRVK